MDTVEISTTQEPSNTPEQTTFDDATIQTTDESQPETQQQKPETENVDEVVGAEKTQQEDPQNWEKIAKDNHASFTRVSQELADLRRQQPQQPQLINDVGQVNPQFEAQFNHEISEFEVNSYAHLSKGLELETRVEVEQLLDRAYQLHQVGNNQGFKQIMSEVKEYFNPEYIEQISAQKAMYEAQKGQCVAQASQEQRLERGMQVAQEIQQVPEVFNLINPESATYSEPVLKIFQQLFQHTGGIDTQLATGALSSIKEIGVKEYLAKQEAEKNKVKSTIPGGDNVQQENMPDMTDRKYWEDYYAKQ